MKHMKIKNKKIFMPFMFYMFIYFGRPIRPWTGLQPVIHLVFLDKGARPGSLALPSPSYLPMSRQTMVSLVFLAKRFPPENTGSAHV